MSRLYSFEVKCSHCDKSLMDPYNLVHDKPSIRVNIKVGNEEGLIHLCSLYGCYEHEANIELVQGTIVDFFCPHCEKQMIKEEPCETCGAPIVPLALEIGGKVGVCSRKGCKGHYIAFEDLSHALHLMYNKFGYAQ